MACAEEILYIASFILLAVGSQQLRERDICNALAATHIQEASIINKIVISLHRRVAELQSRLKF
jgi:hypothetical protein